MSRRPIILLPITRPARRGAIAAVAAATCALSVGVALAAPVHLDPGFGTDGRAAIDAGTDERTYALAVQPDGKVVAAGASTVGVNNNAAVFRFDAAGRPDRGFNEDGAALLGDLASGEEAQAVAVQPDGKLVAAGSTSVGHDGAVWRLGTDGSPDMGFGDKGLARVDSGGTERLAAVVMQPDGKIVVAGVTSVGENAVVYRLNTDGSPDKSFDQDGAVGLDSGAFEAGYALAVQPDGKIVVAGFTRVNNDAVVYRLNTNGSPDKSFDEDGAVGIDAGRTEAAYAVAVQPDGKIVLAGGRSGESEAVAWRLTAAGSPDKGFGSDGMATLDAEKAIALGVALQPDGKIVIAGAADQDDAAVWRLNGDGSPDAGFDADGTVALGSTGLAAAVEVAVQSDGKIVTTGRESRTERDAAVYRLLEDSSAEPDPVDPDGSGGPGGPTAKRTCAGKRATIVGTARPDRIRGTRARDVIAALGGRDVVRGLGGNDLVCAGRGNDRLYGGRGRDTCVGGRGRDRIACERKRSA